MKALRVLLSVACLSLPACYSFDFPLDPKPQVPVDARLLGAWRCLATQADLDEGPGILRITRQTEFVSKWNFESPAEGGAPEKSDYEVYASTVKGGALLNAREVGEKAETTWSLVRYTFLLPDVLRIQAMHDEPFEKIKDAKGLRKAVEKRRDDPEIYADFMICVRPAPPLLPSPSPSPTPRF